MRRRRSRWLWFVGLLLLASLILADQRGWLLHKGADLQRYDGRTFAVVAVIDGDTLDIAAPDGASRTTRVRLWGIDTPELSRNREPAEPWSEEARQYAEGLALGRNVTLSLEAHRPREKYGRLLAFVTLPDGSVLNERLLLEGLTPADDRWPHRDVERYARLEEQAKRERVGLWE
jgi:micrococcal nuclease